MNYNWGNAGKYGLLGGFFGGDPEESYRKYGEELGGIPGQVSPYIKPYFEAGVGALPTLQQQYGGLMNDPTGFMNKLGAGYQQSPGFKLALEQALAGANRSAAAGGMAGSPSAQTESMDLASGMASRDYNQYLQNAMGIYGTGLAGESGLAKMGAESGQSMANMIANVIAKSAQARLAGREAKSEQESNALGSIAGTLMTIFGL